MPSRENTKAPSAPRLQKKRAVKNRRMRFPLTLPWRGRVGSHRAKQDARRGGVTVHQRGTVRVRDFHPTPPRVARASTLPLQGRVKASASPAQRGHGAGIPVKSIHTICFYRMQTGGHAHAQSADFLRRRPPIARGPSLTMRHKRAPRMGARRRKPGAGGCSYRIWPCRLTVLAGPAKVSHNHRRRDDRETAEPHDRFEISGARHAR